MEGLSRDKKLAGKGGLKYVSITVAILWCV